jgi:hypothetical protein
MAERRSVAGRYVMPMEVLKRRPDEAVALGRLGALANALTSVAGWAATSVSTAIGRDRDAYTRLLTDPGAIYVGGRGTVTYVLGVLPLVVQFEIRENAVWRYGRVFLRCPRCSGRVTRIYLPNSDAGPACRQCWGLTYRSRMADYKLRGPFAYLGSWGEAATVLARERRREASAKRWAERRALR